MSYLSNKPASLLIRTIHIAADDTRHHVIYATEAAVSSNPTLTLLCAGDALASVEMIYANAGELAQRQCLAPAETAVISRLVREASVHAERAAALIIDAHQGRAALILNRL